MAFAEILIKILEGFGPALDSFSSHTFVWILKFVTNKGKHTLFF